MSEQCSYLPSLPYVIGLWIHVAMLFPILGPIFPAFPGPSAPAGWANVMVSWRGQHGVRLVGRHSRGR